MTNYRRRLSILVYAVLAVSPWVVDAQELKPIRISLSLGSAQLPLWAAREAGFFAKHGLNVELIGLQSASRQVQLILAGDTLAASLSGTTPIRARIEGADTIIMMGLLNSFTLSVITVPEIKKPADLKGKFIGVGSLGGSPTLLTQRLLKKWGLEADVKFLGTGGYVESVAALEKRRVHAAVLDPPRAYIGRKKFGFTELANLGQEFKYATTVIVARESQLRRERETFSQFAKGVIEGIHRVKTDREFAIKVLGKMLRSTDRDILEETYRVFSALYERTPYPALEGIQPILDEIATQLPKAKNYKPDDFVDTSIVKQLEQSGFIGSVYR
jgi:ABC-type nitrate/sulfonate/bicarbonate transport system substrate-binding protein